MEVKYHVLLSKAHPQYFGRIQARSPDVAAMLSEMSHTDRFRISTAEKTVTRIPFPTELSEIDIRTLLRKHRATYTGQPKSKIKSNGRYKLTSCFTWNAIAGPDGVRKPITAALHEYCMVVRFKFLLFWLARSTAIFAVFVCDFSGLCDRFC